MKHKLQSLAAITILMLAAALIFSSSGLMFARGGTASAEQVYYTAEYDPAEGEADGEEEAPQTADYSWLIINMCVVLGIELALIAVLAVKVSNKMQAAAIAPVSGLLVNIVPPGALYVCLVLGILIIAAAAVIVWLLIKDRRLDIAAAQRAQMAQSVSPETYFAECSLSPRGVDNKKDGC